MCQVPEAPQIAATPAFGKGQPQCRVLAGSGSSLELWELPLLSPEVQGPFHCGGMLSLCKQHISGDGPLCTLCTRILLPGDVARPWCRTDRGIQVRALPASWGGF